MKSVCLPVAAGMLVVLLFELGAGASLWVVLIVLGVVAALLVLPACRIGWVAQTWTGALANSARYVGVLSVGYLLASIPWHLCHGNSVGVAAALEVRDIVYTVPLFLIVVGTVAFLSHVVATVVCNSRRNANRCERCSYPRPLHTSRCPECGHDSDPDAATASVPSQG